MKQTLSQTSTHTPAIAGFLGQVFLAYTGTDNQLHVLQSSDGGNTFFKKWDLNEYSFSGPSLAVFRNRLYIAWTGTDQYRLLNVMSTDIPGPPTNKVTILEDSAFSPVLAVFSDQLFIAWTGVDRDSLLNVMPSADGQYFDRTRKVIIGENSVATPGLASVNDRNLAEPTKTKLFLSWTGTDQPHHLNILSSEDGKNFTDKIILNTQAYQAQGVQPPHDLTSPAGPALLTNYLRGQGDAGQGGGDPWLFLARTSYDGGHLGSTLFQRPNTGIDLHSSVRAYQDTSSAGPALGQIHDDDDYPFIAWIGSGNNQLNVARLSDLH